jgi:Hypothetical protein (DUF2513)
MPKRDMDLVRTILLHVEAEEHGWYIPESVVDSISKDSSDAESINYHLRLLGEAGYLDRSGGYAIGGLTWAGHDFVDSVRDPDVWAKTKKRAQSVGAWTFDILKEVAKSIVKDKLREIGVAL